MFKKLFTHKGFTLAEIMVALGILSATVLVITSIQNQSIKSTKDARRTQAINELIQLMTAELTKLDVCKANFQGKTFNTVQPIADLKNSYGKTMLAPSTSYIDDMIKVTGITGIQTGSKLKITVTYTAQKTVEATAPAAGTFSIDLNVFADATNVIYSCFSDRDDAIKKAVEAACSGPGATYAPLSGTYGTCIHKIKLKDSANTDVGAVDASPTRTFTCPVGEMLGSVEVAAGGYRILKCKKFEVNTTCGNWEYMSGVDANGNAICNKILDLTGVGTTGFVAHNGSNYIAFTSLNCAAGKVLKGITITTGGVTPNCTDPYLTKNCTQPGYYAASTNDDGSLNCQPYPNNNACSGGQANYASAVNNVGVVTCTAPTLSNTCGAGQAVVSTTSGGAVVCGNLPP